MLRIIHTADWHLGQWFHNFDRDYEHRCFFDWLLGILAERRPDALLVSGDVFDSINPSALAQRRLYEFLGRARAVLPTLQILLTAGNHDAAARLEAPAGLLESLNITVIGTVDRDGSGQILEGKFLVPLKDSTGTVRAVALAVPFLRPSDVPHVENASDCYLEGIRELYRRLTELAVAIRDRDYPGAALIGLGHCHMQDGAESLDSERRLIIGGAEALRRDTFPPELVYVALGHLHKPQSLDGGRIRYSGSPIPLSFSERDYKHGVLEVVLDGTNLVSVEALLVPRTASLLRIPAKGALPIEELLETLGSIPCDPSVPAEAFPFLEVRVLDDGPDPTRRSRIEAVLAEKPVRLASIKTEPKPRADAPADAVQAIGLVDLQSLDPETILLEVYRERFGSEPLPAMLAALREICQAESL
jgi:exonuclease SbcD